MAWIMLVLMVVIFSPEEKNQGLGFGLEF